jgi:hypothetical protein
MLPLSHDLAAPRQDSWLLTWDTQQLKDKSLFIQEAFIDGQWVAKDNKFDVFGQ